MRAAPPFATRSVDVHIRRRSVRYGLTAALVTAVALAAPVIAPASAAPVSVTDLTALGLDGIADINQSPGRSSAPPVPT